MALARCGIVRASHPTNVIWLDSDFECGQVDLSGRVGGKLTSPHMEKNRQKVNFKATWTINEEIQTKKRNHARLNVFQETDKCDRM